jgi:hypothetical protein
MEKDTNSAASCVGSINNSTGGVSTGLSLMLFSLVEAAAHMVTDNKNQRLMRYHMIFGNKLLIAAYCSHSQANGDQRDFEETYAAHPDYFQDIFTVKF